MTCGCCHLASAGFAAINLPPRQAGSSIIPGKVNPVIPEVVNQVAFEVIGNDLTVTMAAEAGQLQLNAFDPIIARSLFASLATLTAACTTLADHSIEGITATKEFLRSQIEASIGVVTVLNPLIGYGNCPPSPVQWPQRHRSCPRKRIAQRQRHRRNPAPGAFGEPASR